MYATAEAAPSTPTETTTAPTAGPLVRTAAAILRKLNLEYNLFTRGKPVPTASILSLPSRRNRCSPWSFNAMYQGEMERTALLLWVLREHELVTPSRTAAREVVWVPRGDKPDVPPYFTALVRLRAAIHTALYGFMESLGAVRGPNCVLLRDINRVLQLADLPSCDDVDLLSAVEELLPPELHMVGGEDAGWAVTIRPEHAQAWVAPSRLTKLANGTDAFHEDHVLAELTVEEPILALRRGTPAHAVIRRALRRAEPVEMGEPVCVEGTSVAVVGSIGRSTLVTRHLLLPLAAFVAHQNALPDLLEEWSRHHAIETLPAGLPDELRINIARRSHAALRRLGERIARVTFRATHGASIEQLDRMLDHF
jgi:hypothetical protein